MLELQDVYFTIRKDGADHNLVDQVSLRIPAGHFMAIVGPSGCGKTTLLKTIAGLQPESAGALLWEGRNLATEGDFAPSEIGYVPQFSVAYDPLTVDESVEAATRLRVRSKSTADLDHRIDRVLEETGLTTISDRLVKVLSGGQKRRLGLAMELVSDPKLLLCDEVTSGLDPRSEREIVHLLHDLSRKDGRIVLSVTHSLAHLELYDSVLVLHEGRVAFHGPPDKLNHYFSVKDTEEIYPQLTTRSAESWQASWQKHGVAYDQMIARNREKLIQKGALLLPAEVAEGEEPPAVKEPGFFSQFKTLLSRRWRIFLRDRGQVMLQLAILLCFPILVTIFSDKASGNIRKFSDTRQSDFIAEIQEQQNVRADQAKVGSAISGIIMFQVVLLALMGSNNSAREIAGERPIYEKEKFGGLRPSAYLASKLAFLSCLVVAQSLWMAFFVNYFGEFRGDFFQHAIFLLLINGAMTSICLGISSLMRTAEQASLLSIYLVGFQLPLSGAVLALPEHIEAFTRPFISAYWAWSGSVDALQTQVHTAVKSIIDTSLSVKGACLYTLAIHIGIGVIVAWAGARRAQWE
ncbi:ATP-binding cassette domain-containing protein [Luteolibacter pohnpeiensis]|uniref:ATP-binding cassette domain-containing protein n=1 Tax=Luteolibacter pohnpeiensis TaxID=454153 RepID=A0A934SAI8_9BACT|nr:ATP-binding cassette domain-containing protein [Luteolibacter pohnpeiensis]MBK1881793.1 ATP-binding cassette domain-containing protein [Luteolibacter pohnpeiensis]